MTVRTLLRSGWIPFALVVLLGLAVAHRAAQVDLSDLLLFGGYVVGWLTLPGTLCWRLVSSRRGPRPLAEDLAIGTLVGYVLEFPVYGLCVGASMPRAYLAWPAVVLVASLATPRGRRLWQRTRIRVPLGWSWATAGLTTYLLAWFGHNIWGPLALTSAGLHRPYVDEPFHLSLAAGLKHQFPPDVLYVDDTPLKYHWLSHLHMAAASTVSGVDLIVVLRTLAIPMLVLVTLVAAAHIAVRLTGAGWTGLVLLAGLLVVPVNFAGWNDNGGEPFLSNRLEMSPSAGFVNAALLLGVLVCIELLRRELAGAGPWLLAGLTFVAMLGAKSTSLATVMGGLIAATGLSWLLSRRLDRVAAGLSVVAVVAFAVGTPFFFGNDNHGMSVKPFALALGFTGIPEWLGPVVAISFLGYLSTGLGLLALLLRRGWEQVDRLFLVLLCLAGIGAALFFHQQALSEYYFLYVVLLPLLLGGVLGLHWLVTDPVSGTVPRRVIGPAVAAFLLATVVGLVLIAVDRQSLFPDLTGSAVSRVLRFHVLPMVTVLVLALVVALAVRWTFERRSGTRLAALTVPLVVLSLAGLGTAPTLRAVGRWPDDPWRSHSRVLNIELIAPGGIAAATWLREHTPADTLVATNAHCQRPGDNPCNARNFWMAGYSERQFLVEGWSYLSWNAVGKESPEPDNTITGPFWDPERLADNDAAFEEPSEQTLDKLRERGVRWLLVDRRYPVDVKKLRRLADVRMHSGRYLVLHLR